MDKADREENNDAEAFQNLLDKLRNAHLSLKESTTRCQTDLKTPGYIPSVNLLEDPDKQKTYRAEYINNISTVPEPAPLYLDAHEMQRRLLDTIACRSNPTDVKDELGEFFKRRASNLQHKKYKILVRWAHQVQVSATSRSVLTKSRTLI